MVDPPPLIRPTTGPLRAGFRYDRATPFAPGQRRGATFAAGPGEGVAAPCRGRVTFAGRTPQGTAVTVRCGAWTATVLGIAPTVGQGTSVAAGRTVGRASGTAVGLSLRPVGERWGYVDPRPSLTSPRTGTPLGRAPRARWSPSPTVRPDRASRRVTAPATARRRPVAIPVASGPAAVPVAGDPAIPDRVDPRVVAIGLALAALGLPALRRRRRSGPTGLDTPRLWTGARPPVPSKRNGLLRHHPDLLRQRRATPRARVLDDRR